MRSWHGPLDALLRLERQTTDDAPLAPHPAAAIPTPRAATATHAAAAAPAEPPVSGSPAGPAAALPAPRTRRGSLTG
jgi:hypothetical protein